VPETNRLGELVSMNIMDTTSIIIITDEHFLYIKINNDGHTQGKGTIIFKSKLSMLDKCEVYKGNPNSDAQKKKDGSKSSLA
jgi:hypothetical protein